MAQQNRVGSHATTIHSDDSGTHVVYHNTAVVTFTPLTVTLRNGGWQTVTTKLRMNQTARQFDLNYHVYQQDYQWFVDTPNGTVPFFDGIQFSRKKRPLSPRQRLEESGYEIISNAKRHWYHIRKIRHQFGDGQFNIDPSEKNDLNLNSFIVYRQNPNCWHLFWNAFEATSSGSDPSNMDNGSLGDVLDDTRAYSRALINAPSEYLDISEGLYQASSDAYNSHTFRPFSPYFSK